MWIGEIDYGLVYRSKTGGENSLPVNANTILTEVYANDKLLMPGDSDGSVAEDLAFINYIKLKAEENSLAFRLSTGIPYSQPGIETGYYYRLKGVDKEWKAVSPDNRLISYPYLKWGSYELQIGYYDKGNRTIKIKRTIDIKIAAPWYQTWWFRLMLALVVTYIIFQLYNHYRLRNNLRMAEEDRKKTLELAKMKINFFTTMGNELKTPLTKIMGAISHLLNGTVSSSTRKTLQEAYQDAEPYQPCHLADGEHQGQPRVCGSFKGRFGRDGFYCQEQQQSGREIP